VVDLVPDTQWIDVFFPERAKQGETYTSSGICQERQITGFLRDAGLQKRRKFARNVQGWIHSGPENKCDPRI
jgi:hypothetical protein